MKRNYHRSKSNQKRKTMKRSTSKQKRKTRAHHKKQKGGTLFLESVRSALLPLGLIAFQQTMTPKRKKTLKRKRRRRN